MQIQYDLMLFSSNYKLHIKLKVAGLASYYEILALWMSIWYFYSFD